MQETFPSVENKPEPLWLLTTGGGRPLYGLPGTTFSPSLPGLSKMVSNVFVEISLVKPWEVLVVVWSKIANPDWSGRVVGIASRSPNMVLVVGTIGGWVELGISAEPKIPEVFSSRDFPLSGEQTCTIMVANHWRW